MALGQVLYTKVDGRWMRGGPAKDWGVVYYTVTPDSEEVLEAKIRSKKEFDSLCNEVTDATWYTKIGGVTVSNKDTNVIVGVRIGEDITSTPTGFLADCYYLRMPLTIPSKVTTLGNGFLFNCTSFNQPLVIPDTVEDIGISFLQKCSSFNSPILLSNKLTSIKGAFLFDCTSFNKSIVIPSSVTTILNGFLYGCSNFNSTVTLSNTLQSIGDGFMQNCSSFNKPLTVPNTVTKIGSTFLAVDTAFNSTLTLSSNLTDIGDQFLAICIRFNQPLTLPSNLESIGYEFLRECYSFHQPMTLPQSLTSVGRGFMTRCESFYGEDCVFDVGALDATIAEESLETFSTDDESALLYTVGVQVEGDGADSWIERFPTTPEGVTGSYRRLYKPTNPWGYITYWSGLSTTSYETIQMASQADWNSLGNSSTSASTTITIQGVTLTKGSSNAIRSVSIGPNVTSIPAYFLYYCTKIGDTNINFKNVTTINTYCLTGTVQVSNAVIGNLELPGAGATIGNSFFAPGSLNFQTVSAADITAIPNYFMRGLTNFTGTILCGDGLYGAISAQSSTYKKYTFSAGSTTSAAYTTGITLSGPRAADIKTLLPDSTTSPYRKLKVA